MPMVTQEDWNNWYPKVYGYFYRRVSSQFEVEELTASTMNDFFLVENVRSDHGLLWKIARNKLLDYIKKKKIEVVDYEELQISSDQDIVYNTYYNQRLERLKKCMEKELSDQDKEIVELSILDDFSSKTIAEKLQISADNVRQKLSRSLKKLKKQCRQVWVEA